MAVQDRLDIDNRAFYLSGNANVREAETLAQDAGRSIALAPKTVMGKDPATGKWNALESVDAVEAPATAICGANGTNLAGWQAVTDGAFQITVNGVAISLTGMNFSTIGALEDVAEFINAEHGNVQFECHYDEPGDNYYFVSTKTGEDSTITVLSAGASGTDISGAGFLNGTAATLTQGTGDSGVNVPTGIYIGDEIAAATIVAGDVTDIPIVVGGNVTVDREQVILEGSLTLATVVPFKKKTIEDVLAEIGIFTESTVEITGYENS